MPPPTTLAAAWGKTPSSNPCLGVPSTQSSARPREAPHIWAGLQRVQRRGGMSGLRHKCNQPLGPWEEERARREPFRRCEKRQETRRSAAGVWRRLRKGRRAEGDSGRAAGLKARETALFPAWIGSGDSAPTVQGTPAAQGAGGREGGRCLGYSRRAAARPACLQAFSWTGTTPGCTRTGSGKCRRSLTREHENTRKW